MVDQVLCQIESVTFKGYGLTHINGKVVFVPLSLTGDQGWVRIIEQKKNFSIGILEKIHIPSPWRVLPKCNLFGRCGGCQWQHIDYSIQPELKREILLELLKKIGRFIDIPPIKITQSSNPYGYRTRVQLKVKEGKIGFFEMKSHNLVELHSCPISHPLINEIICLIKKELSQFLKTDKLEINVSPEEEKGVLIFQNLILNHKSKKFLEAFLKDNPLIKGIAIKGRKEIVLNNPYLYYRLAVTRGDEKKEIKFRISPGSFYQINLSENKKLVEIVVEFAEVSSNATGLDLYSGIGNFTIPLSLFLRKIIGIEANETSFDDAIFNLKMNKINNCRFIYGKVEDVLVNCLNLKPNLIVLDPPRGGCKNILEDVIKIRPEKIIYISCDPATLSRDLFRLCNNGYSLKNLSLIDMFPQTFHMEVVALLKSLC